MGLKQILVACVATTIFLACMILIDVNLSNASGTNQSVLADPTIAVLNNSVLTNISAYVPSVGSGANSFTNNTPTVDFGGIALTSVTSIWKNFLTLPFEVLKAIFFASSTQLGGGDTVVFLIAAVILAVIVAVLVFYAWKWIRTGDPD